ncbi:MAG: hypothetical protein WEF50_16515 [Myxococcota bacterium]
MTRPRLVILARAGDRFHERHYLVQQMIPQWESLGLGVVVTSEDEPFVSGDAALLHVDLTLTPDGLRRLAERYPRVLNGRVLDIRKRSFSGALVSRTGPDPGRVIVKTDWNCGGRNEFRLAILESRPARLLRAFGLDQQLLRFREWLEEQRPWARRRWIHTSEYRVLDSRGEVPAAVWRNPNLIVERFLAERDGERYSCRHWVFFGDRERSSRTRSIDPAVKGRTSVEPLHESVPEALRAIRSKLGFDYGKFDYGIVDGELILYDVNRTPGTASNPASHAAAAAELSPGIRAFFPALGSRAAAR